MKLVFSPSAKRVIPYPPVALGVLTSALREHEIPVETRDLEIEIAVSSRFEELKSLLGAVNSWELLVPEPTGDAERLRDALDDLADLNDGEPLGISVMGFEQLAAALALTRAAFRRGSAVLLGGQFWTAPTASDLVSQLSGYGRVAVTVGDGWRAVVDFATNPQSVQPIENTITAGTLALGGVPVQNPPGGTGTGGRRTLPPEPTYDWCRWECYEAYGARVYRDVSPVRRAHLYVWDKICTFRCVFCRVASGSKARLLPDSNVGAPYGHLVQHGVGQMNVMTNEINPSLTYMRRFLEAMRGAATGRPPSWFTYVRADEVQDADFEAMRAVGGRLARFGVESGSQPMLDRMRKDYQVSTMETTLRACARADIWTHVNLLIGFPGETAEDIKHTIEFLERNVDAIHSVRINPFYLPPDTPMARAPEEFGIRLTAFDKGWWNFEPTDGSDRGDAQTSDRLRTVAQTCEDLGIGFAGADPFFLLNRIDVAPDVGRAMSDLKQEMPGFWRAAPTDVYKALVGGYATDQTWENTVNKRQRNYSLSLCTD